MKSYDITVLDEVEARLRSILQANGYSFDLINVKRSRKEPFKPDDYPSIFYYVLDKEIDPQYTAKSHGTDLYVIVYTKDPEGNFVDELAPMVLDVNIALNRATAHPKVSDTRNVNLGGLVDTFNLKRYSYQIAAASAPYCSVEMVFEISWIGSATSETFSR